MRNCWSRSDRNARHASRKLGTKTAVTNTSATFLMDIHFVAKVWSFGERKLPGRLGRWRFRLLPGTDGDSFEKIPGGPAEITAGHAAYQSADCCFGETSQTEINRVCHRLFFYLRIAFAIAGDLFHQFPFHNRSDHFRATHHYASQAARLR